MFMHAHAHVIIIVRMFLEWFSRITQESLPACRQAGTGRALVCTVSLTPRCCVADRSCKHPPPSVVLVTEVRVPGTRGFGFQSLAFAYYLLNLHRIAIRRRMLSSGSPHAPLVGMQNGAPSLEDSWVVSYKAKHTLTIHSRNRVPRHLPKWI